MKIYFAPMEGMTDGILRQTHNRIFGGVDVYCLPFHKLTQSLSLLTREERDISPEENEAPTLYGPPDVTKEDAAELSTAFVPEENTAAPLYGPPPTTAARE